MATIISATSAKRRLATLQRHQVHLLGAVARNHETIQQLRRATTVYPVRSITQERVEQVADALAKNGIPFDMSNKPARVAARKAGIVAGSELIDTAQRYRREVAAVL